MCTYLLQTPRPRTGEPLGPRVALRSLFPATTVSPPGTPGVLRTLPDARSCPGPDGGHPDRCAVPFLALQVEFDFVGVTVWFLTSESHVAGLHCPAFGCHSASLSFLA